MQVRICVKQSMQDSWPAVDNTCLLPLSVHSLVDEAQSDPSSRPALEETLHDLFAAGEDTDAGKTAQRILDLAAAGVQQELDASAATSPAPEAGQQAKAAVTAPAQKATLNVSAAAFVPRSVATAVATAQHPSNLLPAVSPVVDATPSPLHHASWAPAEHQSYACDWSAASNAKLTAGGAAELLSLWFPQYGATALQQLFEINQARAGQTATSLNVYIYE